MSTENLNASKDYYERYLAWKASKDAEIASRKKKPLAISNPNVSVNTPMRADVAKPAIATVSTAPPQTPTQQPLSLPAPPSATETQHLSREEQLKAWREQREQAGRATPSRYTRAPLSPRRLNIKGPAQRTPAPPGTPQIVKPEHNKQNTQIADTRALALHAALQDRPAEGRMLLLQLRQADPSVVHNPYWWIARARLEEEAHNKPEVLQLFEQAIKECHTDAYAMLEDGLRSFMMREINAGTDGAPVSEEDLEDQEGEEQQQQVVEEAKATDKKELQEIDALLASPSGAESPQLFASGSSAMTDLTTAFEALAVAQLQEKKDEEAANLQTVTVKLEIDQDPELGFITPYKGNAAKTLAAAIIARKRADDATVSNVSEHTEESTGSVIAYEQVKVGKKDKEALGTERAMTPVRRSARTGSGLDEKKSFKEALVAANYAFAPNSALAPRQEHTAAKSEIFEIADYSPAEQHDAVPQSEVIVKEGAKEETEPIKPEPVAEVFSEYGRYDTYAPSAAGARLVSRVASPRTAANLVAITPVRRSRRLPGSSKAAEPQTPSANTAVIVPNLHVATPSAKSAKTPKNKK